MTEKKRGVKGVKQCVQCVTSRMRLSWCRNVAKGTSGCIAFARVASTTCYRCFRWTLVGFQLSASFTVNVIRSTKGPVGAPTQCAVDCTVLATPRADLLRRIQSSISRARRIPRRQEEGALLCETRAGSALRRPYARTRQKQWVLQT